jgi:4-hydroxy-tetrahydrodipicolinate synthase
MSRLDEQARGVYVISATPFDDDQSIDWESADRLTDFYLQCGVHGITLLGMMGEAQKLTLEEAAGFSTRVIRRVDGRVPVVVGVSAGGLAPMAELTRRVMGEGASAVLVAPPTGLRTDDQIFDYARGVVEALGPDVPVIYQDYPPTTNVYLSSTLFLRMVRAFRSMIMLKLEDCPGLDKLTRIRADAARDHLRRVSVLIGNGGLYFPQFLRRGADGAMTGFAFPDVLVSVFDRFTAGDLAGAEDLFDAYLPLMLYEQQPGFGLAVRKEILRRRGAIRSAVTRAPGPRMRPADVEDLDALIGRLERRQEPARV